MIQWFESIPQFLNSEIPEFPNSSIPEKQFLNSPIPEFSNSWILQFPFPYVLNTTFELNGMPVTYNLNDTIDDTF